MNPLFIFTIITLTLLSFTGCQTTLVPEKHARNTASLDSEGQLLLTRPNEQGLKLVGRSAGEATSKKILGLIEIGEPSTNITADFQMIGSSAEDSLEKQAAYNAVRSMDGDAFYKTTTYTMDNDIFFGLYKRKTVGVTGLVYEVEDLGRIDAERYDKIRPQLKKPQTFSVSPSISIFTKIRSWIPFL